jgi:predicted methyltransferase
MLRAGSLEGRRIIILGDDDSVSLALGLVGKHLAGRPLARRVTVLELDPERRAFIERVAAAEEIEVEVIAHDLRKVLPAGIAGAFDVFETDPPYTLEGAELFLTRAVEALERGRGEGYFSFAHWPPRRMLELQRGMGELGLAIKAVHPSFNAYQGAAVLGGTGQLIELSATGARLDEAEDWRGPLYTAEVAPRERSYRCTRCRKSFHLGEGGVPATIERLKAQGCPACGNHRFERAG